MARCMGIQVLESGLISVVHDIGNPLNVLGLIIRNVCRQMFFQQFEGKPYEQASGRRRRISEQLRITVVIRSGSRFIVE